MSGLESTAYIVLASFGETIQTMIPVDAFSTTNVEGADQYMIDNEASLAKRFPNATSFVLYNRVAAY